MLEVSEGLTLRHRRLGRFSARLGPASVQAISRELFQERNWGPMAESETFAHLEHMVNVGMAERWEEGGVLHYRVAEAG